LNEFKDFDFWIELFFPTNRQNVISKTFASSAGATGAVVAEIVESGEIGTDVKSADVCGHTSGVGMLNDLAATHAFQIFAGGGVDTISGLDASSGSPQARLKIVT